jgi:class 3 adenylate cyclase
MYDINRRLSGVIASSHPPPSLCLPPLLGWLSAEEWRLPFDLIVAVCYAVTEAQTGIGEIAVGRRLAAILAADVAGYSKLMSEDESGTLDALRAHRASVFDPQVSTHGGRFVKLMGDGALVEFQSVVDAVECAIAVQEATTIAANAIFKLRIGINLGDVIAEPAN